MNAPAEKKAALWKEGLKCFYRHWRDWLNLAVWFMILLSMLSVINMPDANELKKFQELMSSVDQTALPQERASHELLEDPESQEVSNEHRAGDDGDSKNVKKEFGLLEVLILLASLFLGVLQYYVFNVFFLTREPLTPSWRVERSGAGLWYFFRKWIKSMFIIIVPALLGGFGMGFIAAGLKTSTYFMFIPLVVILVFIALLYLSVKYMLIGPLATSLVASPLKVSWKLAENNWWRLLGNSFLVLLVMLAVFIPVNIVSLVLIVVLPKAFIVMMVVQSVVGVLIGGVFSAFNCAACRILCAEQQQKDPSFALVKKG